MKINKTWTKEEKKTQASNDSLSKSKRKPIEPIGMEKKNKNGRTAAGLVALDQRSIYRVSRETAMWSINWNNLDVCVLALFLRSLALGQFQRVAFRSKLLRIWSTCVCFSLLRCVCTLHVLKRKTQFQVNTHFISFFIQFMILTISFYT